MAPCGALVFVLRTVIRCGRTFSRKIVRFYGIRIILLQDFVMDSGASGIMLHTYSFTLLEIYCLSTIMSIIEMEIFCVDLLMNTIIV